MDMVNPIRSKNALGAVVQFFNSCFDDGRVRSSCVLSVSLDIKKAKQLVARGDVTTKMRMTSKT